MAIIVTFPNIPSGSSVREAPLLFSLPLPLGNSPFPWGTRVAFPGEFRAEMGARPSPPSAAPAGRVGSAVARRSARCSPSKWVDPCRSRVSQMPSQVIIGRKPSPHGRPTCREVSHQIPSHHLASQIGHRHDRPHVMRRQTANRIMRVDNSETCPNGKAIRPGSHSMPAY